jgi:micrococcal nuclease
MKLRRGRNNGSTNVGFRLLLVVASAMAVVSCAPGDLQNAPPSFTAVTGDRTSTADLDPCPTPAAAPDRVRCADVASVTPVAVLRVVDGDTFHARINGVDETIRFFGIDTPERGQPCFTEATLLATQLLDDEVTLVPDARDSDRYGRLLRYVYTPDGHSIDALLIDEGVAHAWRDDGALRVDLIALEDRARAAGTGCLWSK